MSILYSENGCALISHKEYIDRIYSKVVISQDISGSDVKRIFVLRDELFEFTSNTENGDEDDERRHRKMNAKKSNISISKNPDLHDLNQNIATKSKEFLDNCKGKHFFKDTRRTSNQNIDGNSRTLFKAVSSEKVLNFPLNGSNTLDNAIFTEISSQSYLIPPNCKFTNSSVSEIDKFANELYDLVVIDPPWFNKYIRRVRVRKREEGYDMMYNEDILKIPLEDLVHSNSIVAIWCTNSPTHSEFIKNIALPKWNLKLLTTYYWVKITNSGDPVCRFNVPLRKQPYEKLFLAAHIESERAPQIDVYNLLFSIPSVVHSHKPPLLEVFKDHLPSEPKCLEIFARYLIPHFTSIGREVLKLQSTILFNEQQHETEVR